MNKKLNLLVMIVVIAALFTACSRPAAQFQPSETERFYTRQTTTAVAAAPVATPAELPADSPDNVPAPVAQPANSRLQASDALVSLNAVHTTKRMTRRMERVRALLTEANRTSTGQTAQSVQSAKKASLLERMALKSIDKKIKKHLAPKEGQALTGYVRLGLIIAAVGVVLLLIGNSLGSILGLVALLGGLALVVVGLLEQ